MGSDDDRKKKKKDRKRDKKKASRDRSPSSSSNSSQVRRKKKIKKKSQDKQRDTKPQPKYMPSYPYPAPPHYPFMPHPLSDLSVLAPPPPNQPAPASLSKAPKTKEPNLFKLLPTMPLSCLTFANTVFSANLAGADNLEQLIAKMWKHIDKKVKGMGIKRLGKLVAEGIATHDRLALKEETPTSANKAEEQVPGKADFDVLTAIYSKRPFEEVKALICGDCQLSEADIELSGRAAL